MNYFRINDKEYMMKMPIKKKTLDQILQILEELLKRIKETLDVIVKEDECPGSIEMAVTKEKEKIGNAIEKIKKATEHRGEDEDLDITDMFDDSNEILFLKNLFYAEYLYIRNFIQQNSFQFESVNTALERQADLFYSYTSQLTPASITDNAHRSFSVQDLAMVGQILLRRSRETNNTMATLYEKMRSNHLHSVFMFTKPKQEIHRLSELSKTLEGLIKTLPETKKDTSGLKLPITTDDRMYISEVLRKRADDLLDYVNADHQNKVEIPKHHYAKAIIQREADYLYWLSAVMARMELTGI